MSSTLDTLLDEELNNGYTVLTIDEPTRSIQYDGELILGVEHDKCAERIYFVAPKIVGDDIDLSASTTRIDIKFTNGYGDSYYIQATDVNLQDDGNITFSWLLTEKVAVTHGKVSFCICAKQIGTGSVVEKEWHTAPFIGKIITGIDVDNEDVEIITDITCVTSELVKAVENYSKTLENYQQDIDDLATLVVNRPTTDDVNASLEALERKINGTITAMHEELSAIIADHAGRISALENYHK